MNLVVNPPVLPMLAKRVSELPPGEGWIMWEYLILYAERDKQGTYRIKNYPEPGQYVPENVLLAELGVAADSPAKDEALSA